MRSFFVFPRLLLFLFLWVVLPFRASGVSASKWVEVQSPHFTVVSDAGEKQARQVADQFEQIREVFQNAFSTLRADMGKPIIIFALKNENSMKALLPAYWEVKGHAHPAGIYIPGEDKHCAVVRTNIESLNPYEVIYHEYAHALENLNFEGLPLWLAEGVAEFLGNSRIYSGFVEIGVASPHHLSVLRENKLIPLGVLLGVDANSPYYNEKSRASQFYAESWALTHYLLMDSDARQRQLLQNFLIAYQRSGDQLAAARQAFGDLTRFAETVDAYTHRQQFLVGRVNTSTHVHSNNYSSRTLTPAEADALRGDLYIRTHRPKEAKMALESALQQNPNLALAHEGLGFLALSQHETEKAEVEFSAAVQLNSKSFVAYYFNARVRMRDEMRAPDDTREVIVELEKAVSLNPQFAPAYEALATLYSLNSETTDKAVAAGQKAMQLEPGTFSYALSYGYVLLRIGKVADAMTMAVKIQGAAKSPEDQSEARQLSELVLERESYDTQVATRASRQQNGNTNQQSAPLARPPGSDAHLTYDPPFVNKHTGEDEFAVDGTILSAECPVGLPGKLTLVANNKRMSFTIPDINDLQVLVRNDDVSSHAPKCAEWKGRRARLFFYKLKNRQIFGELSTLQLF